MNNIPGGAIYWCLSCNRRVPNYNSPFCSRHQWQRELYARDLRRERTRPVKIEREDLHSIHTSAKELVRLKDDIIAMRGRPQQREAISALLQKVIDLDHFLQTSVPKATVTVPLRSLASRPAQRVSES